MQITRSTPQRRETWSSVRLMSGISRYSERMRSWAVVIGRAASLTTMSVAVEVEEFCPLNCSLQICRVSKRLRMTP
jgi:hypothetical protein